jgi:hypothetical protein
VTIRNINKTLWPIFLAAIVLFFCSGLQSASACMVQEDLVYNPAVRVDSCHLVSIPEQVAPCCQSEACHQTTPRPDDFGSPEYQRLHHDSYLLVHEVRPLTPQSKAGVPFVGYPLEQLQTPVNLGRVLNPRQALHNLRTIILLN